MYSYEDYLLDALETVIYRELPEEGIYQAVIDQAHLLAGDSPEIYDSVKY